MHKEKKERLDPQAGISYVELLVVIVIVAIVASLALMQRGNANEQFQRQNAARELKVAFERARFDSVKRRAEDGTSVGQPDLRARVAVTANSFVLTTFRGTTAETVTYNVPTGIEISVNSGSLNRTVYFDRRGEAKADGDAERVFLVCNGLGNNAGANDRDVVLVTPTGTVNLLTGGAVPTPLPAPAMSSVDSTTGLNPHVQLPVSP